LLIPVLILILQFGGHGGFTVELQRSFSVTSRLIDIWAAGF
jgi:hypothetical protein